MPIRSYKIKEGTLSLGSVGTTIDATAQVTEGLLEWEEAVEDSLETLSGDTLEGDATYTAKLSGKVIQDLEDGGLTDFSWDNKGTIMPFEFTPATASGRVITGSLRMSPLAVGGEVGTKGPTSDFEWQCIGEPVLGAGLGG